MGISDLLPRILPSAGTENYDLRALSDGLIITTITSSSASDDDDDGDDNDAEPARKRRSTTTKWKRRKVRIAVDVNGWIARACHGHGGLLMDERHLSYRGRAELREEEIRRRRQMRANNTDGETLMGGEDDQEYDEEHPPPPNEQETIREQQRLEYIAKCISSILRRIEYLIIDCATSVLLVLDGATPPCKRDAVRARSDRRTGAEESRDEAVIQSPPRNSGCPGGDTSANRANNAEAARTEAEVLRRISASNRAGTGTDHNLRRSMIAELLKVFRDRHWPFIVAPYEADGQLSYLASCGAVDIVVTEDSDLIALGVPTLIYKLGGWNGSNDANRYHGGKEYSSSYNDQNSDRRRILGTMLQRSNLGSSGGIDLLDFSDAMLVIMFVSAGCDYCDSLLGIGIVTAWGIVKRAFHGEADEKGFYRRTNTDMPVLRAVLDELFNKCNKKVRLELWPLDDPTKDDARNAYEHAFLAAIAMFRHPLVYDPILGEHVVANDVCEGNSLSPAVTTPAHPLFMRDERILMEYEPYRELVTNRDMLYRVIGMPLKPENARDVAMGNVDPRTFQEGVVDMTTVHENNDTENDELGTQASSSGHQLSGTQDFSGVGTQQSTSSGMISSLSPDLLASPSPKKRAAKKKSQKK